MINDELDQPSFRWGVNREEGVGNGHESHKERSP